VTVSGGGSVTASASDPTTIIVNPPVLSITKTHTGDFAQEQHGAAYIVAVSNATGAGTTTGSVTVTDTVPPGLMFVSIAGSGWQCTTAASCTRNDALAGGATYPPITVTVDVRENATSPQVNDVVVSGGGSANATASDSTTII